MKEEVRTSVIEYWTLRFWKTIYFAETYLLQKLFSDTDMKSVLSRIVESINEDEKLLGTTKASFIAPTVEQNGEFLMSLKCLYFIGEESPDRSMVKK